MLMFSGLMPTKSCLLKLKLGIHFGLLCRNAYFELMVDFRKVNEKDWIRLDCVEGSFPHPFQDQGQVVVGHSSLELSVLRAGLGEGTATRPGGPTTQGNPQDKDHKGPHLP